MSSFLAPGPVSGLASTNPVFVKLCRQKFCKLNQRRRSLRCSSETSGGRTSDRASGKDSKGETQPTTASSSSSSSSTPWPASSWPRPSGSSASASPVCRECRGRRVISSAAGPLPCPACISWRRRPDYKPGQPLLSVNDINLKSLDQPSPLSSSSSSLPTSSSPMTTTSSVGAATERPIATNSGGSSGSKDGLSNGPSSGSGSSGDEEGSITSSSTKPKDRRGQNMTEQKRLAIKMAMQSRGPLDSDHKRRISNAMRERYASDPSLRQSGKPKKCSHCGQLGHNRKKCPELTTASSSLLEGTLGRSGGDAGGGGGNSSSSDEESEGEEVQRQGDSASATSKTVEIDSVLKKINSSSATATSGGGGGSGSVVKTCSVCGETGHNKRSCPQVVLKQEAAGATTASTPAKFIVIEESEAETSDLDASLENRVDEEEKKQQNGLDSSNNGSSTSQKTVDREKPLLPLPQPQPPKILQNLRALPGSNLSLTEDGSLVFPLPSDPEQCVAQAAGAVIRAWSDGIRRQTLELLLPQAGSDTAEAWPGGIRQQFRAALPMIESLLLRLKRAEGLEGRITAEWVDEGDCVGAWQSERLAAVVFPTADSLAEVRRIDDALSGNRLILVVNPQWQPQGQIVSDFGFGRTRRAAERYVASLDEVYFLRRIRVLGDEVRVLHCYPSRWQVYYVRAAGDTELISIEQEKPTYQRLLEILKGVRDSRASKSWLDRALDKRWYDDIAAYNEGSPQQQQQQQQQRSQGEREWQGGDDGEESSKDTEGSVDVVRDIITGEIISNGREKF